jgi:hypothetical protein
MYCVDPSRIDLAEEFRRNPYGRHSGELQRLINLFRSGPLAGKYVLIRKTRQLPARWQLGRLGPTPHAPITLTEVEFDDYAAAEWAVFKLRWKDHTGQDLPLE